MPRYVDGFVIPIPKKNADAYRAMARKASKIWIEHGALEYRECIGEDLKPKGIKGITSFPDLADCGRGETVVFAWIVYRSRAHRDKVNAKVMEDPRMGAMMEGKEMPFDLARMAYGGFEVMVDA